MRKKIKKIIQKTVGNYFNILAYISPKTLENQGFQLFCNPMARPVKQYQLQFLEKGKNEILTIENEKIQTYKWGNGSKKIVFIHGWASHTFRWKSYIENLIENDFTVYAFDAPAHGLSTGKMLHVVLYGKAINLMIEKNKEIESIVSHSIGGFAITYWLNHYKENTTNIKKVVIMGAPGEAKDFFDFYQSVLGLSQKSIQIISHSFTKRLGHEPNYFSSAKFATEIDKDCLIIHDKEDNDTNPNYSIRLNQNWKKSQLILTEGLGHNLKSKKLEQKVIDFILN